MLEGEILSLSFILNIADRPVSRATDGEHLGYFSVHSQVHSSVGTWNNWFRGLETTRSLILQLQIVTSFIDSEADVGLLSNKNTLFCDIGTSSSEDTE